MLRKMGPVAPVKCCYEIQKSDGGTDGRFGGGLSRLKVVRRTCFARLLACYYRGFGDVGAENEALLWCARPSLSTPRDCRCSNRMEPQHTPMRPLPGASYPSHLDYMRQALELAKQSTPKPTNYRVGALLLDASTNTVLATGYTLECEGNTHAEQSCFTKLAREHGLGEGEVGSVLPEDTVLYTTVEPCSQRSVGNVTCVERILRLGTAIKRVYVGVLEPETFVKENTGRRKLEDAGIQVILVEGEGLKKEILDVATAGHVHVKG